MIVAAAIALASLTLLAMTCSECGRRIAGWPAVRYFRPEEFDSADEPGSGRRMMDLAFVSRLDGVRHLLGRPLRVNSGYRTPAHNARIGGVPNSAHTKGLAADLHAANYQEQRELVAALRAAGFVRIGQYITPRGNRFVHVDSDHTRRQSPWYIVGQSLVDASHFDSLSRGTRVA